MKTLQHLAQHPIFDGCGEYNKYKYGGKSLEEAVRDKWRALSRLPKSELAPGERDWCSACATYFATHP